MSSRGHTQSSSRRDGFSSLNLKYLLLALYNVSVHGEQIELNPIFIACFTVSLMSYDQLNKHMYFICHIVSAVCLFLFQLCSAITLRLFISKS